MKDTGEVGARYWSYTATSQGLPGAARKREAREDSSQESL